MNKKYLILFYFLICTNLSSANELPALGLWNTEQSNKVYLLCLEKIFESNSDQLEKYSTESFKFFCGCTIGALSAKHKFEEIKDINKYAEILTLKRVDDCMKEAKSRKPLSKFKSASVEIDPKDLQQLKKERKGKPINIYFRF